MYGRFADAKGFGSLPHSGVIVNNIDSNIYGSFLNIILHNLEKGSPSEAFVHSMRSFCLICVGMNLLIYNFLINK